MRTSWLTPILCLTALSCGGESAEPEARIQFQQHALMCDVRGCAMQPNDVQCIQARLEATGVNGVCTLTVGEDRTVSGTCRTPAKEVRDFRLVYYTYYGADEVQLAVVLARLDLRNETRSTIELEFPQGRVTTDFDDDTDGATNIEELCAGTDPRVMGG